MLRGITVLSQERREMVRSDEGESLKNLKSHSFIFFGKDVAK